MCLLMQVWQHSIADAEVSRAWNKGLLTQNNKELGIALAAQSRQWLLYIKIIDAKPAALSAADPLQAPTAN